MLLLLLFIIAWVRVDKTYSKDVINKAFSFGNQGLASSPTATALRAYLSAPST